MLVLKYIFLVQYLRLISNLAQGKTMILLIRQTTARGLGVPVTMGKSLDDTKRPIVRLLSI